MFKRYLFTGLIVLLCFALSSASHKFYVSITQVDMDSVSRRLEISARIFSDDLAASVLAVTGQNLLLGSVREHPDADSILFNYFLATVSFKQDGRNLDLKFVGKEIEADVTWLYIESVQGMQPEKPVVIRNALLQEHFPDQKNLVNLKFGKQTVSQIHSKGTPEYSYQTGQ